jgi:hypothetical protein
MGAQILMMSTPSTQRESSNQRSTPEANQASTPSATQLASSVHNLGSLTQHVTIGGIDYPLITPDELVRSTTQEDLYYYQSYQLYPPDDFTEEGSLTDSSESPEVDTEMEDIFPNSVPHGLYRVHTNDMLPVEGPFTEDGVPPAFTYIHLDGWQAPRALIQVNIPDGATLSTSDQIDLMPLKFKNTGNQPHLYPIVVSPVRNYMPSGDDRITPEHWRRLRDMLYLRARYEPVVSLMPDDFYGVRKVGNFGVLVHRDPTMLFANCVELAYPSDIECYAPMIRALPTSFHDLLRDLVLFCREQTIDGAFTIPCESPLEQDMVYNFVMLVATNLLSFDNFIGGGVQWDDNLPYGGHEATPLLQSMPEGRELLRARLRTEAMVRYVALAIGALGPSLLPAAGAASLQVSPFEFRSSFKYGLHTLLLTPMYQAAFDVIYSGVPHLWATLFLAPMLFFFMLRFGNPKSYAFKAYLALVLLLGLDAQFLRKFVRNPLYGPHDIDNVALYEPETYEEWFTGSSRMFALYGDNEMRWLCALIGSWWIDIGRTAYTFGMRDFSRFHEPFYGGFWRIYSSRYFYDHQWWKIPSTLYVIAGSPVSEPVGIWPVILTLCFLVPVICMIDPPSIRDIFGWYKRQTDRYKSIVAPRADPEDLTVNKKALADAIRQMVDEARVLKKKGYNIDSRYHSESTDLGLVMLGVERVLAAMPEPLQKHYGKEGLGIIRGSLRASCSFATGPKWADATTTDLKKAFCIHYVNAIANFTAVMPQNSAMERILGMDTGIMQSIMSKGTLAPNTSLAAALQTTLNGLRSEDERLGQYPEWITSIDAFLNGSMGIMESKTVHHFEKILAAIAMAPTIGAFVDARAPGSKADLSDDEGFAKVMLAGIKRLRTAEDISSGVAEALLFFLKFAYNLQVTGGNIMTVYNYMERGPDDDDWLNGVKYNVYLKTGTHRENNVTLNEIWECYDRVDRAITLKLKTCQNSAERAHLYVRAEKVIMWKEAYCNFSKGGPKPQPFSMTLFGSPGVGKTTTIEFLKGFLHALRGIKNPSSATYNEFDAFQTSLNSATTMIIGDDLGQLPYKEGGIPVIGIIINFVNTIATAFTGADIESKGTKWNNASFVLFTTNSPTMGKHAVRDADAIYRRMGLKLNCIVKPEYVLHEAGKDKLDVDKLDPKYNGMPYWLTYQEYDITPDGAVFNLGKPMDHVEVTKHIQKRCDKHFLREDARVAGLDKKQTCDLCEHRLPTNICTECSAILVDDLLTLKAEVNEPAITDLSMLDYFVMHYLSILFCMVGPRLRTWLFAPAIEMYNRMSYFRMYWQTTKVIFYWAILRAYFDPVLNGYVRTILTGLLMRTMRQEGFFLLCLFALIAYFQFLVELVMRPVLALNGLCDLAPDALMASYSCAAMTRTWDKKRQIMGWFLGTTASMGAGYLFLSHFRAKSAVHALTHTCMKVNGKSVVDLVANKNLSEDERRVASKMILSAHEEYMTHFRHLCASPGFITEPITASTSSTTTLNAEEAEETEPHKFIDVAKLIDKVVATTVEPQSWKKSVHRGGDATGTAKTMTLTQLLPLLENATFTVRIDRGGDVPARTCGFMPEPGFLILPNHSWLDAHGNVHESMRVDLETHRGPERTKLTFAATLYKVSSYKIPGQDLRVCVCNVGGPVRNLTALFPSRITPHGSTTTCTFYGKRVDGGFREAPVFTTRSVTASSRADMFEALLYNTPFDTEEGMCMSFIVRECGGVTIEGFHLAGSGSTRHAAAGICVKSAYLEARDALMRTTPVAMPTTELEQVNTTNPVTGVTKTQSAEPNPRSPANFMVEGFQSQFQCDLPRGSRASKATVEINPYIRQASEAFMFERSFGVPVMDINREYRNAIILGATSPSHTLPHDHVTEAFRDFVSIIPLAVKNSRKKDWFRTSPLNYEEVLHGIDNNPHCSSINVSTSAGHPFGVKKKNILEYNPHTDRWDMPDEVYQHVLECEAKVLGDAQHSGLCYTATLKSEPRALDKCDTSRVFFSSPFATYIMVQKWLGPLIWVVNDNPELFETSLGRDRLSPGWFDHLKEILDQPQENGLAIDFGKYDMTQNQDLRNAAVNVFVEIARELGYDDVFLQNVRYIAGEFLYPLLNLGGFVTQGVTTQPSGNNLTAHSNGFGGSILLRTSFFKKYSYDDGCRFRDYVKVRNLGDDNYGAVTPKLDKLLWNQEVYAQDCTSWGLKATPPVKTAELGEFADMFSLDYLKSKPYYNEDLKTIISVLDPNSIFKPLQVIQRSTEVTIGEQMIDIVTSIVRECQYYGREAHDWAVQAAVQYLTACGFPSDIPALTASYDAKVNAFQERYDYVAHDNQGWPTMPAYPKFWVQLRAESEVGNTEGITTFEIAEVTETVETGARMVSEPMTQSESDTGLASFFDRPIEIARIAVPVGSPFHRELDPFTPVVTNPLYREKMAPWSIGRADVELTFVATRAEGHCGTMMISAVPLPHLNLTDSEANMDAPLRRCTNSQRDVLYWDITTEGGAKYVCRYSWQFPAAWLYTDTWGKLCRVTIESVGTVLHQANAHQPVWITVYARLVNYHFSGATSLRPETQEPFSSKVSALANMTALASKYLAINPGMAMITDYASMTLEGVAGVARYFGHSRPLETERYMFGATSPPMATFNNNLPGRSLALDKDHGVSMSSQITGRMDVDELTFAYLLSKKVILGIYKWDDNMGPDTVLFNLNNTCCPGVYGNSSSQVAIPAMSLVTSQFGLGHWKNHFNIRVITPIGNAGTLRVVYEPTGHVSNDSTVTNHTIIHDINTSREIPVSVEWQQPHALLATHPGYFLDPFGKYVPQCMNGSLQVRVESPLSPFSGEPQTAWIVIEGWIDADVVLGNYAPMDLSSYTMPYNANESAPSRPLAPLGADTALSPITVGPGFFSATTHSTIPSRPTVRFSSPPSRQPAIRMPSAPSAVPFTAPPVNTPSHVPTLAARPTATPSRGRVPSTTPTTGDTLAPTVMPVTTDRPVTPAPTVYCAPYTTASPPSIIGTTDWTTQGPYLNEAETVLIVPSACTVLTVPYFSNTTTPSRIEMDVVCAASTSFTLGSQVQTAVGSTPVVWDVTPSAHFGMTATDITISAHSDDIQITGIRVSTPGGYGWAKYTPPGETTPRSTAGGFNVDTIATDQHTYVYVPYANQAHLCGNTNPQATLGMVMLYCEGTLPYGMGEVPDMMVVPVNYNITADSLQLSSGYDTPQLFIRSMMVLAPLASEATIGSPYVGKDMIAPIHLGEQIASLRALWKVFKSARLYILDPHDGSLVEVNGITSGAVQSFVYNVGESWITTGTTSTLVLTLDRVAFLSYGCVRGGMTSLFTAEFGDGMVKFRRAVDDSLTENSGSLRGFEQMHTSIQRSIAVAWPCYLEEKYLVPRSLNASSGSRLRMIKQVELSTLSTATVPLVVREDTSIGEDFSISYFIGAPILEWGNTSGTSIAPPAMSNTAQDQGAGTFAPSGIYTQRPVSTSTTSPSQSVTYTPTAGQPVLTPVTTYNPAGNPATNPTGKPVATPTPVGFPSFGNRKLEATSAPPDEAVKRKGFFFN